jgi:Protein of unknown function (DUF3108)
MTAKRWAHAWLPAALALLNMAADAADPAIPTYTATYEVEYKGKIVGTSEFKVVYDDAQSAYEFTSHTVLKGLLKLASPNPVIERSRFRVEDGRIRPLEFWYEDGSRKGEDNLHVVFDWDTRVALVSGADFRREIALEDGALDRATVQVALMSDLNATGRPGRYLYADEDGLKAYAYTDNGDATTPTGLGSLATKAFVQQREGSTRSTWLWVAPELGYLPVRIEQRRDGEVQNAFTLAAVEGLGAKK